ncbi:reverse transcriptase domain-containing protein [Trichonephila inaurata madagascariensis]|uniref:Reverse transcriptase domain-containing protein n=1 Tax=Trichonephila inaurata madagascariensis TaxID=2747483 RepID=A0A8X7BNZ1_9ARAC|nr:reverse transcriptase domain-containing protein [Trichonephila inaurata madagascariensis]
MHSSELKQKKPQSCSRNLNLVFSVFEAPVNQNELAYALRNLPCETSRLLAEEKVGLRISRSTNQHVALLNQFVKDGVDNRQVLTAVFIYLKSAYGNVWWECLLLKLSKLGIIANLFNFIRGFLCQRSCRVRYGNILSKSRILKTGLPQGAVSSCSLFEIYINDLILNVREISGVKCLLYADDLVFWTVSKKKMQ